MELLPCVEIEPRSPEIIGSIIWMHGLGASGHDFEPIVPHLHLPQVRFVFPHAPRIPVTINAGYVMPAWYDILTWERVPERENRSHIARSRAQITALIHREVERGVPEDRILLAGFSQGAAMALHTGLRHPTPLLGIAVLSGYLIVEDTLAAEVTSANATTPLFFGHGRNDDVVPPDRGQAAYARVRTGRDATWKDYPMAHQVIPAEIADLRAWLHARFLTSEAGNSQ
jgi:phospholipase/carboxylesterase